MVKNNQRKTPLRRALPFSIVKSQISTVPLSSWVVFLSKLLLRLTAVRPPRVIGLFHAGSEVDIHLGRYSKAETLCDLLQIQLVDVEDGAQRV